jgi:2',3'-cyclic-nucleotide 2'-phosphodiesterase (5'-nucleotidase family)
VTRRATKIAEEQAKGDALLVLDAGDSLVGDQDPAKKTQGETGVAAMNLMDYDAMTLGPGELALGLEVLRQRIAEAEFVVLSANAVSSDTGELVAVPYTLQAFDGHQAAIIGLSGGSGTPEISILDPLETAQSVVAQVMPRADVIILLSHAGTSIDQQIAENVPGIDLIISGGKFELATPWRSEKTGTLILHADEASPGHAGRRLGIARLTFDTQGQLVEQAWQRLDLSQDIPEDPEMANWVWQQVGR